MLLNNKETKGKIRNISKMYRCIDLYEKMSELEKIELNNILSEDGRNFLRFYLLPNKLVKKYDSKRYDGIKDDRDSVNIVYTFLVNEIIEAMTILYFQKEGYFLEYNKAATRLNSKNINSDPDFVLHSNGKDIYVELQTYQGEQDSFTIKASKHKDLMNLCLKGKKVYLLNKYITKERTYYTYIDYNDVIDKDKYSYVTDDFSKFGGKLSVKVESPEKEISFSSNYVF